jgi:hypothetical protein
MAVWVTVVGIKIIVHDLSFINWMLADNGPGAVWFTEFLNNTMVRSDGIGAETRSVWRHFLRLCKTISCKKTGSGQTEAKLRQEAFLLFCFRDARSAPPTQRRREPK